jgi:hypothetical protein
MNDPLAIVVVVTTGLQVALLLVGAFLVVRDTIRGRGRWGINGRPVRCPRCDELMPMVRVPRSLSQALWGGGTCSACWCEMDKWGNEVPARDDD